MAFAALLGAIGTPQSSEACSTGEGFEPTELSFTVPADGATEVAYDVGLLFRGVNLGDLHVDVTDDAGEVVGGQFFELGSRARWEPDLEFEPGAAYTVHLWTDDGDVDETYTFTTGSEPSPTPAMPVVDSFSIEGYDEEIRDCVAPPEPGSCEDCGAYEVIAVERRMRLRVRVSSPPQGEYRGFYSAALSYGTSEQDSEGGARGSQWWGEDDGEEDTVLLSEDFGLAGEWEGEEVCVRVWNRDLHGGASESVVQCLPIGEVNDPGPEDEGSTGDDSDDDGDVDPQPEAMTDTDGASDPSADGEAGGCSITNTRGGGAGVLLLGLLGLLRRRRHA